MKKVITFLSTVVVLLIVSVIVSFASGDIFDTAEPISLNNSYIDNIVSSTDKNFYKFTLNSPGSIYINFQHENLFDKSEFWTATIYDVETNYVASYSFYGTDTNINTYNIGLEKGNYYLLIKGGRWFSSTEESGRYTNSAYTFNIKYIASNFWEKENNNENFKNAQPVKFNSFYSGSICQSDDEDCFKITLDASGCINLNFSHKNLFDQSEFWTATIYDVETNYVASYSFYGTDTNINTYSIGLDKGSYYLLIRGGVWFSSTEESGSYTDSTYTFNIKYTASNFWEKENNNENFNSAQNIGLNTLYYGSICQNNDKDFYRFEIKSRKSLNIYVNIKQQNNNNEFYYIILYDASTNQISKISIPGNVTSSYFSFTLSEGTYYIRVTGGNWFEYIKESGCYTTNTYALKIEEIIPTVKKLSYSSTSESINLKWGKAAGVTGYEIYRYDSSKKKYVKIKTTSSTKYKASKLKSGTTYKYKVRAYIKKNGSTYYGAFSSVLSAGTKPTKTTLSSVKSKKPAQLTATWKTVSGATGYEVTYSTSKKFTKKTTKTVTIKKAKTKKTTIKKLKKGKKYYVKVRAYKTVSGKKIYGAWSSVKSVKVK